MYKVTAFFKEYTASEIFTDKYDAIEYKDSVDAHYPKHVTFEEGIYPMRTFIVDSWNGVMNHNSNPLRHIPDTNTRHLIMQILAWMWCIAFAIIVGSWTVFGVSAIIHIALLAAIAVTVGTFETAKRKPNIFVPKNGYHTLSRSRQNLWMNGQRIELDPRDPGGEHE
jgi:hypothetical protein